MPRSATAFRRTEPLFESGDVIIRKMNAATASVALFAIQVIFGAAPRQAGEIQRFAWPRSDLHVTAAGVSVEPGLAFGSWAAFGGGMVMGDLVLKPVELDAVVRELETGGFEISAIHNHLTGESPEVVYIHYSGHGDPDALASTLSGALGRTSTPRPSSRAAEPLASPLFDAVSEVMQRKGTVNGKVLQFSVPRAEAISEDGMAIPPAMGVATAINVQTAGKRVATTGDFVLLASEVNPVIRELQAKGITVTALHSHMLRETPRLFFLHFWGVGEPRTIGEGLRNALARTNVK
jgi:hypothetical protein